MSEWQPISTAPRDGTRVLLYDQHDPGSGFARVVGAWDPKWKRWFSIPGSYTKRPSHWMALPPPPSSRAGGRT